ncbi:hypothetical protein HX109_00335 [Galbibacter sp. BG1]|uniref:hypothetical protein n=1 Tax=Galbibacter sp. BG1 TaxID=1170699 RepID=UPI0015B84155|nr:hypothetical protein [Galbibacter sp. BG1]QLE00078.1 hypothetical protein HX109_00335 [Galbibacter sp. BG1]
MIRETAIRNLQFLNEILLKLSRDQFKEPIPILNQSSIGMHVRHVLEFYECLLLAISEDTLNYDNRKREKKLESDLDYCLLVLNSVIDRIETLDEEKALILQLSYAADTSLPNEEVATTVKRELIYNIEHTVHHLAIIKIGIKALDASICIDENMGVAASTIRNKRACAQ